MSKLSDETVLNGACFKVSKLLNLVNFQPGKLTTNVVYLKQYYNEISLQVSLDCNRYLSRDLGRQLPTGTCSSVEDTYQVQVLFNTFVEPP
jgi:hypothetical protein